MEQTPENIAMMMGRLQEFAHYPGFPVEEVGVTGTAKAILGIVQNDRMYTRRNPQTGEVLDERVEVANDLEWLFNWLRINTTDRFPLPGTMRLYYQKFFKPADGYEIPTSFGGEDDE
jgi:hypothetical protein